MSRFSVANLENNGLFSAICVLNRPILSLEKFNTDLIRASLKSLIIIFFILSLSACKRINGLNDPPKTHSTESFSFALIGDMPYDLAVDEPSKTFDRLVRSINADTSIRWVLHAGDIKKSSSPCSEKMFKDRLKRYNQFDKPFILTPGDNEWTDCHRIKAGQYQPLERLSKLREVFYSEPNKSLGAKTMALRSQANDPNFKDFPENVLWQEKNVVFATMHLVGSQNGTLDFDSDSKAKRTLADDDEIQKRTEAAIAWLDEAFRIAKNSPAIFLMIHANPGMDSILVNQRGFEAFLAALQTQVRNFLKPVVLAHGDTHKFRIDSPVIKNKTLENFKRVETFGVTNKNWLKVTVDPKSKEVFFFEKKSQ